MENKINIAELLKDCPQGMELDCTTFDNVRFQCVSNDGIWIEYIDPDNNKRIVHLTCYGNIKIKNIETECVIFPKGKTTWKGFHRPFKDGDVLAYTSSYTTVFIYRDKDNEPNYTTSFYVGYTIGVCYSDFHIYNQSALIALNGNCDVRLATEEEKQKLFDAIKDNGYKWNAKTKTLEKLVKPKFKVGDRITSNKINLGNIYNIIEIKESVYIVNENNETNNYCIDFVNQDYWKLVSNKFDINTLVPFKSRVLVRNEDNNLWKPAIYGFSTSKEYCIVGGSYWWQCIPYEGNEHLLNTTNDCDDFYKTWK